MLNLAIAAACFHGDAGQQMPKPDGAIGCTRGNGALDAAYNTAGSAGAVRCQSRERSQPTSADSAGAPTFATPPVAIVPLDNSIPGAALEVAGPLQAWNGRAYITGSGTITAWRSNSSGHAAISRNHARLRIEHR